MTRLAHGLFAVLVLATVAAFFVAQRLKSTPPVVQDVGVQDRVSPNRDGRFDRARISFQLKRRDVVDVAIIDAGGETVRLLADGLELEARRQARLKWDGRADGGRRLPDGIYRPRLLLRRQGRSVILPRTITLDATPPSPQVLAIGPSDATGPELLPRRDGRPAQIRFRAPGRRPSVEIWRTDVPRPRVVAELELPADLAGGEGVAEWDGTRGGRRVGPGTYAAVVRSRDTAGNIGESLPERILEGRPRRGEDGRGPAGITVRYLGLQPPVLPVGAGREMQVGIDARGATFNWSLRRVGAPAPVRRSRRATGGPLRRRVPDGKSGLFLFEARTRDRLARVPVAVDDRRDHPVLVVLPATTWQGRNLLDDDGDGVADSLDRGLPVRLERVFAGDGLPPGFEVAEAPLLAHLDRRRLRYDLTTDVALAVGRGPALDGHRGVLLAGDTVWLTEDVRRGLRGFVARGGTLASLGTGSLRAEVRQTADRLVEPTRPEATDLFGARLGRVERRRVPLTILEDDPRLQLFAGEEGLFERVEAWEPTQSAGSEARLASSAVTPDGRAVIVAARFGRGLVVRPGIPGFASRLSVDVASAELLARTWTLLRTG